MRPDPKKNTAKKTDPSKPAASKMSAEERRADIIRAVRRVFAEKGFHGTTTRDLAEAAGVSEALLFKHFPTKEALYTAMQRAWSSEHSRGWIDPQALEALEPSTATLIRLVRMALVPVLGWPPGNTDEEAVGRRLMMRSIMEDGEFARLFMAGRPALVARKIEECLQAAVAVGDAAPGALGPGLGGWFAMNLAVMVKMHLRPEKPVVDYGLPREQLAEQMAGFILRGMGLKAEAIARHHDPRAFRRLAEEISKMFERNES